MRAIFVFIKCEMGQAYRVAQEAADTIEALSELHSTSGQYDLLGKFYLEADQDIGRFVTERIQTLPGVADTHTLITFNAFTGGQA
jgi:DNA-binding Lrp family transcriptional regulator